MMASTCALKTGGLVQLQCLGRGRRENCAYNTPASHQRHSIGPCRSHFFGATHAPKGAWISDPHASQVRIACTSFGPGHVESQTESTSLPAEGGDTATLVFMLETTQAAQDREDAASALWQQSFESTEHLESIGKKPGCIPLLINLLKADTSRAAASAAGLLRNLSQLDNFRAEIAEAGGIEGLVALLERKGTPALVREQAVGALERLSKGRKEAEKIIAVGGLTPSLASLDSAMEEERLAAAGLVSNLAAIASVRERIEEAGAVPKLLKLLTDAETEYSQLVRNEVGAALGKLVTPLVNLLDTAQGEDRIAAAAVLADMAKDKHQKDAIVASGAVDKLLTVLTEEGEENEDMRDAARAVVNELKMLTSSRSEGPRQIEEGYVGLFVRMLGLDRPIEEREEAAEALWHHVLRSRENVEEVGQLPGALPLLVQLMGERERPAAAEAAAGVLRTLATVDAYRLRVYEAGAVEAVISLLQQWTHEAPEVRKEALGLLENLSAGRREGSQILASQGAQLCAALVALSFPPEEPTFDPENPFATVSEWRRLITADEVAAVLGVLSNLAASDVNRGPIASAGAIASLARLLSDENTPAVLQSKAKAVLGALSKQAELKGALVEAGLVPVPLVKARYFSTVAKNLGENQKLQAAAAPEQRKYKVLPRKEGIARLVLMLGLADPEPVKAAAEEMRDLAITEENRLDLNRAGAAPMLARLLASGGPTGQDESPGQGGGERAVEKTEEGGGSDRRYPEVARAAAEALSSLCESREVRRTVEKAGGVEGLVWLLKTGEGRQRSAAAKALVWLTEEEDGSAEAEDPGKAGRIEGLIDLIVAGKKPERTGETDTQGAEENARWLVRRKKVLAAGGVPSLAEMLKEGTPEESGNAASILSRIASEIEGPEAIIDEGVIPALEELLNRRVGGSSIDKSVSLGEDDLSDDDVVLNRQLWAAQVAGARLVVSLARNDQTRGTLQASHLHDALSGLLLRDHPPEEKAVVSEALLSLEYREYVPTVGPSEETERDIVLHVELPQLVLDIEPGVPLPQREHAVQELLHLIKTGSDQEEYLAAIATLGGIFSLVDLLKEGSEKCSLAALTLLDMLSLDEGNHLVMLEAGAEEPLERIARSTSDHWKLALKVLRRLPV